MFIEKKARTNSRNCNDQLTDLSIPVVVVNIKRHVYTYVYILIYNNNNNNNHENRNTTFSRMTIVCGDFVCSSIFHTQKSLLFYYTGAM